MKWTMAIIRTGTDSVGITKGDSLAQDFSGIIATIPEDQVDLIIIQKVKNETNLRINELQDKEHH